MTVEMIQPGYEFEKKHFVPDPDTDTMIPSGRMLSDGMIVLVDSHILRQELSDSKHQDDHTPENRLKVLKYNRWCRVTQLESYDHISGEEHVSFIGVYGGGIEFSWDRPTRVAWYVKKDSLQLVRALEAEAELTDSVVEHEGHVASQVKELVGNATIQCAKAYSKNTSENQYSEDELADILETIVDVTTKKILHLF